MLMCLLSAGDWANAQQRIKHFYSCPSSLPVTCWGIKGGLATWTEKKKKKEVRSLGV